MNKIHTILVSIMLTASVFAQAPEKMTYQAVVRDDNSTLITSTQVGIEINIYQTTASGTLVYTEIQTPTTNINGLLSIEIGGQTGFDQIDWANGPYFIETNIDVTGGSAYTITGVSQLLTVPYALHAKTAETITGGSAVDGSETKLTAGANITVTGTGTTASPYIVASVETHYLGEEYLDGIIYNLYIGSDGQQHGLIVSKTETPAKWQNTGVTTNAIRSWDGNFNMNLMSDSPAKDWVTANFDANWYLPSIDELSLLWHNRFYVNNALNSGGHTLLSNSAYYWSSTEYDEAHAFLFNFVYGYSHYYGDKTIASYIVRSVRAF